MSVQRQPYMVVFDEETAFKDVYGGTVGMVAVEAMRIIPEENSDTAIVFSHPVGGRVFFAYGDGIGPRRSSCDLRQYAVSRQ